MRTEDIIALIIGISLGCIGGIIGAIIGVLSSKDKKKYHTSIKYLKVTLVLQGFVSIGVTFLLSSFQIISFDQFISIFWISFLVIILGGWSLLNDSKTNKQNEEDKEKIFKKE